MKKFLSISISIFLIFLLLPIMLIVALLILLIDGNPISFSQKRAGLNGKIFILYKFRTMENIKIKNDRSRVTKLGKILRNFKLDELPQLFNILKGDLSLVGPRPLLPEYNKFYSPFL